MDFFEHYVDREYREAIYQPSSYPVDALYISEEASHCVNFDKFDQRAALDIQYSESSNIDAETVNRMIELLSQV